MYFLKCSQCSFSTGKYFSEVCIILKIWIYIVLNWSFCLLFFFLLSCCQPDSGSNILSGGPRKRVVCHRKSRAITWTFGSHFGLLPEVLALEKEVLPAQPFGRKPNGTAFVLVKETDLQGLLEHRTDQQDIFQGLVNYRNL